MKREYLLDGVRAAQILQEAAENLRELGVNADDPTVRGFITMISIGLQAQADAVLNACEDWISGSQ